MAFKHSLSIMTARFSTIYKLFLFLLVLAIVFAALSVSVLYPTLTDFIDQVKELEIVPAIGDYASTIFGSQPAEQEAAYAHLEDIYQSFLDIIAGNSVRINVAIVLAILLYFVFVIFMMWGMYSVSDIMHNYMSSNSKFGFASNLVANFVKAMRFSLLYTAISLLYYAVGVFLVWLLFVTAFKLSAMVGCFLTLLIFFALTALRRTVLAGWAPAMVSDGMSVTEALKESGKMAKDRFSYLMGWYFAYYLIVFAIAIVFGLVTFGIGFIFVVIASLMHAQIFDLVVYYRYKGKRYYVDVLNVVDPNIKQRTL